MNLLSILLIATAILAFSTGLMSLVGAAKADRARMAWFFVATLGTMFWSLSIAGFLGVKPGMHDTTMKIFIYMLYLSPLVAVPALLGYSAWRYKVGKFLTIVGILIAIVLGVLLIYDWDLLVSSFTIDNAGNSVAISDGWFYPVYATFFAVCFTTYLGVLLYRVRHTHNKRVRTGDMILVIGMMISSGCTGLFDIVMPYLGNWDLVWVGPLVITLVMIIFFYAIIRYRIVSMGARWMKAMANSVVMIVGVIVYMLLFYTIFTALFKIPNPSASVLVLNFLMIVIVLLLMPVIREVSASLNSMISVGQVDIAYVVRKLNHLATKNVDLRELAGFLADHLHFAYIGFILNGRLYGSKSLVVSPEELSRITHLKSASHEIWQEPTKAVQKTLDELDLKAVAELRNAKGKTFGQLVVGRPIGKMSFERRDLIQLEMIINLVAMVIDSEKHLRA